MGRAWRARVSPECAAWCRPPPQRWERSRRLEGPPAAPCSCPARLACACDNQQANVRPPCVSHTPVRLFSSPSEFRRSRHLRPRLAPLSAATTTPASARRRRFGLVSRISLSGSRLLWRQQEARSAGETRKGRPSTLRRLPLNRGRGSGVIRLISSFTGRRHTFPRPVTSRGRAGSCRSRRVTQGSSGCRGCSFPATTGQPPQTRAGIPGPWDISAETPTALCEGRNPGNARTQRRGPPRTVGAWRGRSRHQIREFWQRSQRPARRSGKSSTRTTSGGGERKRFWTETLRSWDPGSGRAVTRRGLAHQGKGGARGLGSSRGCALGVTDGKGNLHRLPLGMGGSRAGARLETVAAAAHRQRHPGQTSTSARPGPLR